MFTSFSFVNRHVLLGEFEFINKVNKCGSHFTISPVTPWHECGLLELINKSNTLLLTNCYPLFLYIRRIISLYGPPEVVFQRRSLTCSGFLT